MNESDWPRCRWAKAAACLLECVAAVHNGFRQKERPKDEMSQLATNILQVLACHYAPGQVFAEGRISYEINQEYG
jgi:hypothetical protein